MTVPDSAAARFRDAAERYCACVERAGDLSADALLQEAEGHLARLHALVLDLPIAARPGRAGAAPVTGAEFGRVVAALRTTLGPAAGYAETGDPVAASAAELPADVVAGDLAEDLSDVHLLLKYGLRAWRDGDAAAQAAAAREWRFTFTMHWGAILVGALRAFHWRRHVHAGDGP